MYVLALDNMIENMNRRRRPVMRQLGGTSFSVALKGGVKSPAPSFEVVTAYEKTMIGKSKVNAHVQKIINKKLVQQKKTYKSVLIWREFCDVTTFVGLRYIGGKKAAKGFYLGIWIILWISQLALCTWLSSDWFKRYLMYNIKTSTTYYSVEELPFPAITICNENSFHKSIVGGSLPIMFYIASFYTKTKAEGNDLMFENNKTCYKEPDTLMADRIGKASSESFIEAMRLMASDSYSDVLKCWWKSKKVNCSGIFLNHATDYSWCYTFNPDQLIAADSKDKLTEAYVNTNGYGLDADDYIMHKISNAGPRNGLRLLMNVNQKDYCGAAHKYFGAGFYIQVHDPAVQASFLTEKSIQLGPGYNYDVSLRPITFHRETEHLGKCVSSLPLSLYPNAKIYFQMACFTQSMIETVWKMCKCFPFTFKGKESTLSQNFGIPEKEVPFCNSDGLMCLRRWLENNLNQNIEDNFPSCKVPCIETFYESQLSAKKFPSINYETEIPTEYAALKNESTRKNILQVNFYFDSMNMINVDESQAISWVTLMIAFGWTMSLFLGSSFITPFEFIYYMMYYVHEKAKKIRHNNRVISIRQNVMRSYF